MEKCFASCLGDCAKGISREHYISRSLLKLVTDENGKVDLGGPLDRGKPLPPQNLAVAKILCGKHNSDLSDYDSEVNNLVRNILTFNQNDYDQTLEVDSQKVTLWMIKLIVGYYAATKKLEYIGDQNSLDYLVRLLFKKVALPSEFGINIYVGETNAGFPSNKIRDGGYPPWMFEMSEAENRVGGVTLWCYPLRISFFLARHSLLDDEVFNISKYELSVPEKSKSLTINFT